MKSFDTLNDTTAWLREVLGESAVSEETLQPVLGFLLLWGIFESGNFDPEAKKPSFIEKLIKSIKGNPLGANNELIDPLFDYFHQRYTINAKGKEKLAQLILGDTPQKLLAGQSINNFVTITVNNNNSSLEQKLICLFMIIYRFRNNLFHGRKQAITLNLYAMPFTKINEFMRGYIKLSMS